MTPNTPSQDMPRKLGNPERQRWGIDQVKIKLLILTCVVLAVSLSICLAYIWREQQSYARFENRDVAWFATQMKTSDAMIDYWQLHIRNTPNGLRFRGSTLDSLDMSLDDVPMYLNELQKYGTDRIVIYTDPDVTMAELAQAAELLREKKIDKVFINGMFQCVLMQWAEN